MIKYTKILIIFSLLICLQGCFDSVTDSNSAPPVIKVFSPSSNDTVQVGKILIQYQAVDNPNGLGLDHFDIVINDFEKTTVVPQNENGTNPQLYLEIDTSYLFKRFSYFVMAYSKNGSTARSQIKSNLYVSESTQPPEKPANLILTKISDTAVNLLWDDSSSNEANFELWRKEGTTGNYKLHKTLPENTISTDDYGLTENLSYSYKVRATNEFGNSDYSNIVTTGGASSPDVPTDLTGEPLGATQILLSWKDNSSRELGFKVQGLNSQTTNWELRGIVTSNTTQFTDKNLSAGTPYSYRVAAYGNNFQSDWSEIAEVTTANQDIPPPGSLSASFNYISRKVVLRWNDNTNLETGTFIERRLSTQTSYSEIGEVIQDTKTFTDSNLTLNRIYYYRARHSTTEGFFTPYSNEDSAFVPELGPIAPSDLSIAEFTPNALYGLSWKDNSNDEDGFELYRKLGEFGTYSRHKTFSANIIAYNDTVPAAGIYYYKIRSFRNNLYSDFSNEVNSSGNTGGGALEAPTNLQGAIVSGELKVAMIWEDNASSELGYEVERRFSGSTEFTRIDVLAPNTDNYIDDGPGLFRGSAYDFRVRAYDATGFSNYSNIIQITFPF